ncbi:BTB/POZ domain-containing protein NPY3-like isoform X2 [Nymphaea colorata]|nr:BTB/POZ domain-containing protein NPY3-like isoform X2 [Nymphaea colorata]
MKFMKLGSKADSFQSDGNMRYVATELAADLVVNVGDIKFCVHKFPLLSKSARLQKLLANSNNEVNNEVHIPDIPGGASAFEICAKFCYGMVVTLNPFNVIAARCAAEYLEMHEVVEKGNLIYKIEVFLNTGIFRSWKDSIIVLQTTRSFYPWSEELKVIGRSVDYIALMATVDPGQVDWSYTYSRRKLPSENGIDLQWNGVRQQMTVPKDWWVEDLCELEIDFYKRVIIAIKSKRIMSGNLIGEALKAYALKWLPAFGRDQVHSSEATRNRSLVETVIWLLPSKKGCVPCGFLLKLLKAGTLLDIGETAKRELVKKVGIQLDEASAVDLLLPAPVGEGGLYDIDIVQNMVEEFLIQEQSARIGHPAVEDELLADERSSSSVSYASKLAVSKVIDGYLVEIAHDPDLPLTKFIELAEMVPDAARPHKLERRWTFWFDNQSKPKQGAAWGTSLRPVYSFDTVEDFWCLYDQIFKPSKLLANADFHCFKAGIEPKWEDPVCASGGKWSVTSSRKQNLESMWLETLMALIGEQFEEGDEICGVVASVRQRQDKIALWTKTAANEATQISIGRKWKEIVDSNEKIFYSFHDDSRREKSSRGRYSV